MLTRFTLLAAFTAVGVVPALAEDETGKREYMVSCAVCHGESGLGDGPMTKYLNIEVPGLTTLAKENDGEFPFLDTFMVVDGRAGVRGHGTEIMPIWGDRYKASAVGTALEYGAETIARGRISSLVLYIEAIQED